MQESLGKNCRDARATFSGGRRNLRASCELQEDKYHLEKFCQVWRNKVNFSTFLVKFYLS